MNFDDGKFWTGVRLSTCPPCIGGAMSLFRFDYLLRDIRWASHLTRCNEFLRCIRILQDHYEWLPPNTNKWIFEMFNLRTNQEDVGIIASWLANRYPEIVVDILDLSNKLKEKIDDKSVFINNCDWDLIRNGIEQYRRYLLHESHPNK